MKYLIALLIIMFIAMVGISATLIVINLSLNWALESSSRNLAQCSQEIIECNQLQVNKENKEKQIDYQENLEPIDIYNEEELSEFYDIPEEVYIEPREVCLEWKYYAWGNDVCQEWGVIVE